MIAEFVRLSAMYLVVYVYVRHTWNREVAMMVKWLAVVSLGLMVLSVVAPPVKQLTNDIHSAATTYSQGKEAINNIIGNPRPLNKPKETESHGIWNWLNKMR